MDFRKNKNWDTAKLSDGFVFCIQRLDELLFDYTIDSYKPRALNAPSLCIELIKTINEVENDTIDKNNVDYIIDELKAAIQRDKVAKKLMTSNIDFYVGYKNQGDLPNLGLKISVLERCLERYRYINSLQDFLYDAVISNRKKDIDFLLSSYVTTFINWGISKQYLYQKMNDFFFDEKIKIDSDNKLKDFFKEIYPKAHNYSVYFRVTDTIKLLKDSFKIFRMKLIDTPDEKLEKHLKKHDFKTIARHSFVEISNIQVPDPFVARDIAEGRLKTLRNTSQLYFHQSKLKWNFTALVIQHCCENESILATNQINPMKKSINFKSTEVAKNTNRLFKNIALTGESFNKFSRVMELHSNCLVNTTPENQIVILWTILETIVPSSKNKSKVQNICDSIIPILLIKYFNKLFLNLYNDFNRWNKDSLAGFLKDIVSENDNLMEKFALLLISEQYNEQRTQLYESLGKFLLLRNRAFKLSQILISKEKTLKYIENHNKNVSWQIRRVYRTRNMVVHSGKTPKNINILIENTHDYIDQITSEIIDMTTSNYRIYNLEQAFELGKILYSELEKNIKNSETFEDYLINLLE